MTALQKNSLFWFQTKERMTRSNFSINCTLIFFGIYVLWSVGLLGNWGPEWTYIHKKSPNLRSNFSLQINSSQHKIQQQPEIVPYMYRPKYWLVEYKVYETLTRYVELHN